MSITRTTNEFKAFSCKVHKCTSNEVINLDIIEGSQGRRIEPNAYLKQARYKAARERDMALGVWCGFPNMGARV